MAMVILPIIAFGLLGLRLLQDQESLAQHEVDQVYQDRLLGLDQAVQTIVRGYERDLLRIASTFPATKDSEAIRSHFAQLSPHTLGLVLNEHAQLIHPPLMGAKMTIGEFSFIDRTRHLWQGGALSQIAQWSAMSRAGLPERGWLSYFYGSSQRFLWWIRDMDKVIALEISDIDLMTRLVSELPDTPLDATTSDERTVLIDATGRVIYQWGRRNPGSDENPKAAISMSSPLSSWSLRHYASESTLPSVVAQTLSWSILVTLLALTFILASAAVLIWRVRTRESALAAQRVSFVNQVSHELKTPLTNIRMYAELLENAHERMDIEEDEPAARHLNVIIREGDRLSNLIKDVLTFARAQENKLALSPQLLVPDEIVQQSLDTHAPLLAQAGITIETALHAPQSQHLDSNVIQQVLANLLSNVEKYAKSGGWAKISTRQDARAFYLSVEDRGPGLSSDQQKRVFEPFWRASDTLSEGSSGTGIGLDISRQLARNHGGDLHVSSHPPLPGVTFVMKITSIIPEESP